MELIIDRRIKAALERGPDRLAHIEYRTANNPDDPREYKAVLVLNGCALLSRTYRVERDRMATNAARYRARAALVKEANKHLLVVIPDVARE